MFTKDYKKECERLKTQLAENCRLMEDMSKHSDKLHIIKFVVDNPDQFMLDGDYTIDETSVVYGAHSVSFSEAVMFKAGKESALKEYDVIQGNADKMIADLQERVKTVSEELEAEKAYSQSLRDQLQSLTTTTHEHLSHIKHQYEDIISEQKQGAAILEAQLKDKQQTIDNLLTELSKWRSGEVVPEPFPIVTDYGVVEAGLK